MENIDFFYEDTDFEIANPEQIVHWLHQISVQEKKAIIQLNIIFCSDDYLHRINMDYLKHDTLTDIITFPYQSENIEGDLFISVERIAENSQTYKTTFYLEMLRVIAHGVLHLIGYTDKNPSDKLLMTAKENEYIRMGPEMEVK